MKQFCCTLLFFLATLTSYAQNFADFFQDKTLRVDYIFTGDANRQAIYLDELSQRLPGPDDNTIYPNFPWRETGKLS